MITDPISDFIIRLKNGYLAKKLSVDASYSKTNEALGRLLSKAGYVGEVEIVSNKKNSPKSLKLELLYTNKKSRLTDIVRISKPSRRVYAGKNEIPKVLSGLGITIISTSKGLLTNEEAKKQGLGGELICKVW